MKNLITTLKNIWKIEELRTRILVTLGFILIYRLGAQVPLPAESFTKVTVTLIVSRFRKRTF